MQLLDMPPEIFRQVIHELVSDLGVDKAWKYRQVCRIFAGQIAHDTYANQPIEVVGFYRCSEIYEHNVAIVLANRLKKPLHANRDTTKVIQRMADFVNQRLGSKTYSEMQNGTMKLCEGLQRSRFSILDLLGLGYARGDAKPYIEGPIDISQKIVAAIMVDEPGMVLALLPEFSDCAEWTSCLFYNTLDATIIRGSQAVLQTILEWLATSRIQRAPLSEAFTSEKYGFSIPRAVCNGAARREGNLVQLLIEFHEKHLPPIGKIEYDRWICLTCTIKDVAALEGVLRARFRGNTRITRKTMLTVAGYGSGEHMKALFASNSLQPDKTYADASPLTAAIRGHNLGVVRAVLNAGANVNLKVRVAGVDNEGITPMEVVLQSKMPPAVRKSIAQLLVERGAIVPDRSTWAGYVGYAALKTILEEATRKSA